MSSKVNERYTRNYRRISIGNTPIKEQKRRSIFSTTDSIEQSTKISKINATKKSSICGNEKGVIPRIDMYGNLIIKGSKTHKVSFIDHISNKNIVEVILISDRETKKDDRVSLNCASACIVY